jgi:hypothetical protein
MDLTAEHRNIAIARANEVVAQDTGEDDNSEDEGAESSSTMHSFDSGTNQILEDNESEMSIARYREYTGTNPWRERFS